MTDVAPVIVEPTTAIRDWLRTHGPTAGNTFAGGLPQDPEFPAIVVWRVGGAVDEKVDVGAYQFDCCATTAREAATTAGQLQTALISAQVPATLTATGADIRLCGFSQVGGFAAFDPDPIHQRYIVTAQATTISTPTGD